MQSILLPPCGWQAVSATPKVARKSQRSGRTSSQLRSDRLCQCKVAQMLLKSGKSAGLQMETSAARRWSPHRQLLRNQRPQQDLAALQSSLLHLQTVSCGAGPSQLLCHREQRLPKARHSVLHDQPATAHARSQARLLRRDQPQQAHQTAQDILTDGTMRRFWPGCSPKSCHQSCQLGPMASWLFDGMSSAGLRSWEATNA
mmetsp:Transcript_32856/g.60120  ORF Transcript_32856/g.60120 Transcript_32856/m.60120 type:complete len:201 (+) Transcript_32856:1118-1720(+)